MREIPMRYVKANQTGIVASIILFFLFGELWILVALWLIQVVGLLSGGKFNLFVAIGKRVLPGKGRDTQAEELQRFNNLLAVIFLTLSLLCFSIGWEIAGYVFSSMLFAAAGMALAGYCIGCTMYFQFKQLRARIRANAR
ncbi:hypothetical protein SD71_07000 [Cohnella kolymensis]|uniref:DUF4395 domain-containing protein n=1 Tax=Cohnella kolymensis TaxID=1590652 RepID=A0ABR5A6T5_9BACL|nr:DUF4395 domain-containing protein [Cohnella kolymensis]KIL36733.1 hypothetical protein SD71_07000 [Cohnella kolymensis]